ncbi:restriction endonuclease subunit S [Selenomonas sp. oral taxon 892]|uniref:restriction endonuclease subunit S n=1 Tax=Selenomonas sp. oral taxon 892 TaxID=1321785 RepID=UPI0003F90AE1|nr:restriction endonuclease subunit S [Selenomonas sp. oral taxon 892]
MTLFVCRSMDNLHYEKFADGTVKCIEDEIPFEVPESWAWARLQSISTMITDGTHKTPQYSNSGYIFLSSRNVTSGKIDWDNIMYIPESLHQELYSRVAPRIGDILLAKNGTTGAAAIIDEEKIFDIYVSLALIRTVKDINSYFTLYAIRSTYVQAHFFKSLKGIGVPNLHLEHIRHTLIPIPPISEQGRCVSKIEKLIPIIASIQANKENLIETINTTKSKILDLAIRGKLVPQDESDEPASVLLERIQAEKEELIKQGKIKRDKRESVIYRGTDNSYYERFADGSEKCIDEEIPFEIPGSWLFVRLKEIGSIIGGGTPRTSNESYWDGNIYWITPADLSNHSDIYISHGSRSITELGLKDSSATLMPAHTVLYSSRAPIGHIAIAANALATNQGFKSVVPHDTRMSLFVYFCLKERTPSIVLRATGTTFKEISGTAMAETIVPLPPLREQKRICNKIRSLFTLLENMHQIID